MSHSYEDYSTLLRAVQNIWHGEYAVDDLRKVLRTYEREITIPLERAPNPEDAKVLTSSKTVKFPDTPTIEMLSRVQVQTILNLSHAIGCSERLAVRLFWTASENVAREGPLTDHYFGAGMAGNMKHAVQIRERVAMQALHLYHTRRQNLLVAILDLVSIKEDPSFPNTLAVIVDHFLDDVVKGGLVRYLLLLLNNLVAPDTQVEARQRTLVHQPGRINNSNQNQQQQQGNKDSGFSFGQKKDDNFNLGFSSDKKNNNSSGGGFAFKNDDKQKQQQNNNQQQQQQKKKDGFRGRGDYGGIPSTFLFTADVIEPLRRQEAVLCLRILQKLVQSRRLPYSECVSLCNAVKAISHHVRFDGHTDPSAEGKEAEMRRKKAASGTTTDGSSTGASKPTSQRTDRTVRRAQTHCEFVAHSLVAVWCQALQHIYAHLSATRTEGRSMPRGLLRFISTVTRSLREGTVDPELSKEQAGASLQYPKTGGWCVDACVGVGGTRPTKMHTTKVEEHKENTQSANSNNKGNDGQKKDDKDKDSSSGGGFSFGGGSSSSDNSSSNSGGFSFGGGSGGGDSTSSSEKQQAAVQWSPLVGSFSLSEAWRNTYLQASMALPWSLLLKKLHYLVWAPVSPELQGPRVAEWEALRKWPLEPDARETDSEVNDLFTVGRALCFASLNPDTDTLRGWADRYLCGPQLRFSPLADPVAGAVSQTVLEMLTYHKQELRCLMLLERKEFLGQVTRIRTEIKKVERELSGGDAQANLPGGWLTEARDGLFVGSGGFVRGGVRSSYVTGSLGQSGSHSRQKALLNTRLDLYAELHAAMSCPYSSLYAVCIRLCRLLPSFAWPLWMHPELALYLRVDLSGEDLPIHNAIYQAEGLELNEDPMLSIVRLPYYFNPHAEKGQGGEAGAANSGGGGGLLDAFKDRQDNGMTLYSPLFPTYVMLFEALCEDEHRLPPVIYERVARAEKINWRHVVAALKHLILIANPSDPTTEARVTGRAPGREVSNTAPSGGSTRAVSFRTVTILRCLLRLFTALGRSRLIRKLILVGKRQEFALLDRLFDLLSCPYPASVKALVLHTVAQFCKHNPFTARQVWTRVTRSQIIPTHLPVCFSLLFPTPLPLASKAYHTALAAFQETTLEPLMSEDRVETLVESMREQAGPGAVVVASGSFDDRMDDRLDAGDTELHLLMQNATRAYTASGAARGSVGTHYASAYQTQGGPGFLMPSAPTQPGAGVQPAGPLHQSPGMSPGVYQTHGGGPHPYPQQPYGYPGAVGGSPYVGIPSQRFSSPAPPPPPPSPGLFTPYMGSVRGAYSKFNETKSYEPSGSGYGAGQGYYPAAGMGTPQPQFHSPGPIPGQYQSPLYHSPMPQTVGGVAGSPYLQGGASHYSFATAGPAPVGGGMNSYSAAGGFPAGQSYHNFHMGGGFARSQYVPGPVQNTAGQSVNLRPGESSSYPAQHVRLPGIAYPGKAMFELSYAAQSKQASGGGAGSGNDMSQAGGLYKDLAFAESREHTYPLIYAFIKLLVVCMHSTTNVVTLNAAPASSSDKLRGVGINNNRAGVVTASSSSERDMVRDEAHELPSYHVFIPWTEIKTEGQVRGGDDSTGGGLGAGSSGAIGLTGGSLSGDASRVLHPHYAIQTSSPTAFLRPYAHFVMHGVLLRAFHLPYRNPLEKWVLLELALVFFSRLVEQFDPKDVIGQHRRFMQPLRQNGRARDPSGNNLRNSRGGLSGLSGNNGLPTSANGNPSNNAATRQAQEDRLLLNALTHWEQPPAWEFLCEMLSLDSPLRNTLFRVVEAGFRILAAGEATSGGSADSFLRAGQSSAAGRATRRAPGASAASSTSGNSASSSAAQGSKAGARPGGNALRGSAAEVLLSSSGRMCVESCVLFALKLLSAGVTLEAQFTTQLPACPPYSQLRRVQHLSQSMLDRPSFIFLAGAGVGYTQRHLHSSLQSLVRKTHQVLSGTSAHPDQAVSSAHAGGQGGPGSSMRRTTTPGGMGPVDGTAPAAEASLLAYSHSPLPPHSLTRAEEFVLQMLAYKRTSLSARQVLAEFDDLSARRRARSTHTRGPSDTFPGSVGPPGRAAAGGISGMSDAGPNADLTDSIISDEGAPGTRGTGGREPVTNDEALHAVLFAVGTGFLTHDLLARSWGVDAHEIAYYASVCLFRMAAQGGRVAVDLLLGAGGLGSGMVHSVASQFRRVQERVQFLPFTSLNWDVMDQLTGRRASGSDSAGSAHGPNGTDVASLPGNGVGLISAKTSSRWLLQQCEPSFVTGGGQCIGVGGVRPADQVCVTLAQMLLECAKSTDVNLAHQLLGFSTAHLTGSDLATSPTRQVLDSLLELLGRSEWLSSQHGLLCEVVCELLCVLIRNPATGPPLLTYLQHHHDHLLLRILGRLSRRSVAGEVTAYAGEVAPQVDQYFRLLDHMLTASANNLVTADPSLGWLASGGEAPEGRALMFSGPHASSLLRMGSPRSRSNNGPAAPQTGASSLSGFVRQLRARLGGVLHGVSTPSAGKEQDAGGMDLSVSSSEPGPGDDRSDARVTPLVHRNAWILSTVYLWQRVWLMRSVNHEFRHTLNQLQASPHGVWEDYLTQAMGLLGFGPTPGFEETGGGVGGVRPLDGRRSHSGNDVFGASSKAPHHDQARRAFGLDLQSGSASGPSLSGGQSSSSGSSSVPPALSGDATASAAWLQLPRFTHLLAGLAVDIPQHFPELPSMLGDVSIDACKSFRVPASLRVSPDPGTLMHRNNDGGKFDAGHAMMSGQNNGRSYYVYDIPRVYRCAAAAFPTGGMARRITMLAVEWNQTIALIAAFRAAVREWCALVEVTLQGLQSPIERWVHSVARHSRRDSLVGGQPGETQVSCVQELCAVLSTLLNICQMCLTLGGGPSGGSDSSSSSSNTNMGGESTNNNAPTTDIQPDGVDPTRHCWHLCRDLLSRTAVVTWNAISSILPVGWTLSSLRLAQRYAANELSSAGRASDVGGSAVWPAGGSSSDSLGLPGGEDALWNSARTPQLSAQDCAYLTDFLWRGKPSGGAAAAAGGAASGPTRDSQPAGFMFRSGGLLRAACESLQTAPGTTTRRFLWNFMCCYLSYVLTEPTDLLSPLGVAREGSTSAQVDASGGFVGYKAPPRLLTFLACAPSVRQHYIALLVSLQVYLQSQADRLRAALTSCFTEFGSPVQPMVSSGSAESGTAQLGAVFYAPSARISPALCFVRQMLVLARICSTDLWGLMVRDQRVNELSNRLGMVSMTSGGVDDTPEDDDSGPVVHLVRAGQWVADPRAVQAASESMKDALVSGGRTGGTSGAQHLHDSRGPSLLTHRRSLRNTPAPSPSPWPSTGRGAMVLARETQNAPPSHGFAGSGGAMVAHTASSSRQPDHTKSQEQRAPVPYGWGLGLSSSESAGLLSQDGDLGCLRNALSFWLHWVGRLGLVERFLSRADGVAAVATGWRRLVALSTLMGHNSGADGSAGGGQAGPVGGPGSSHMLSAQSYSSFGQFWSLLLELTRSLPGMCLLLEGNLLSIVGGIHPYNSVLMSSAGPRSLLGVRPMTGPASGVSRVGILSSAVNKRHRGLDGWRWWDSWVLRRRRADRRASRNQRRHGSGGARRGDRSSRRRGEETSARPHRRRGSRRARGDRKDGLEGPGFADGVARRLRSGGQSGPDGHAQGYDMGYGDGGQDYDGDNGGLGYGDDSSTSDDGMQQSTFFSGRSGRASGKSLELLLTGAMPVVNGRRASQSQRRLQGHASNATGASADNAGADAGAGDSGASAGPDRPDGPTQVTDGLVEISVALHDHLLLLRAMLHFWAAALCASPGNVDVHAMALRFLSAHHHVISLVCSRSVIASARMFGGGAGDRVVIGARNGNEDGQASGASGGDAVGRAGSDAVDDSTAATNPALNCLVLQNFECLTLCLYYLHAGPLNSDNPVYDCRATLHTFSEFFVIYIRAVAVQNGTGLFGQTLGGGAGGASGTVGQSVSPGGLVGTVVGGWLGDILPELFTPSLSSVGGGASWKPIAPVTVSQTHRNSSHAHNNKSAPLGGQAFYTPGFGGSGSPKRVRITPGSSSAHMPPTGSGEGEPTDFPNHAAGQAVLPGMFCGGSCVVLGPPEHIETRYLSGGGWRGSTVASQVTEGLARSGRASLRSRRQRARARRMAERQRGTTRRPLTSLQQVREEQRNGRGRLAGGANGRNAGWLGEGTPAATRLSAGSAAVVGSLVSAETSGAWPSGPGAALAIRRWMARLSAHHYDQMLAVTQARCVRNVLAVLSSQCVPGQCRYGLAGVSRGGEDADRLFGAPPSSLGQESVGAENWWQDVSEGGGSSGFGAQGGLGRGSGGSGLSAQEWWNDHHDHHQAGRDGMQRGPSVPVHAAFRRGRGPSGPSASSASAQGGAVFRWADFVVGGSGWVSAKRAKAMQQEARRLFGEFAADSSATAHSDNTVDQVGSDPLSHGGSSRRRAGRIPRWTSQGPRDHAGWTTDPERSSGRAASDQRQTRRHSASVSSAGSRVGPRARFLFGPGLLADPSQLQRSFEVRSGSDAAPLWCRLPSRVEHTRDVLNAFWRRGHGAHGAGRERTGRGAGSALRVGGAASSGASESPVALAVLLILANKLVSSVHVFLKVQNLCVRVAAAVEQSPTGSAASSSGGDTLLNGLAGAAHHHHTMQTPDWLSGPRGLGAGADRAGLHGSNASHGAHGHRAMGSNGVGIGGGGGSGAAGPSGLVGGVAEAVCARAFGSVSEMEVSALANLLLQLQVHHMFVEAQGRLAAMAESGTAVRGSKGPAGVEAGFIDGGSGGDGGVSQQQLSHQQLVAVDALRSCAVRPGDKVSDLQEWPTIGLYLPLLYSSVTAQLRTRVNALEHILHLLEHHVSGFIGRRVTALWTLAADRQAGGGGGGNGGGGGQLPSESLARFGLWTRRAVAPVLRRIARAMLACTLPLHADLLGGTLMMLGAESHPVRLSGGDAHSGSVPQFVPYVEKIRTELQHLTSHGVAAAAVESKSSGAGDMSVGGKRPADLSGSSVGGRQYSSSGYTSTATGATHPHGGSLGIGWRALMECVADSDNLQTAAAEPLATHRQGSPHAPDSLAAAKARGISRNSLLFAAVLLRKLDVLIASTR